MRKGLIEGKFLLVAFCLFFTFFSVQGQETSDNENHPELKKNDTIVLDQQNGPEIKVVGYGKLHLSYSETIDGYTILRNNKGVYEYAERAAGGDLKPSGTIAHNPEERERKEILFLRNTPKHLRYKNPKLKEILNKQNRFFRLENDN